ncbi:hypothetical protein [Gluconobacter albidus]|uniref:hypothetical protein n=1 Tax=Gluconobacter albidus TaxID=318683 RepID=UPI0030B0D312
MSAAMAVGGTDGAMFTALLGCQRGTWAHSPLFQWMTNNYEAMSQAITGKKVRWQKMSEAAESAGLTNVNGEPPKPATVRSTWYRVRKAVGAMQRQKEEARNKVLAAREAAKASRDAEAVEAGTLSQRMQEADRAQSFATAQRIEVQDAHARAAVQRQERTQQQAATTQQSDVEPSDPSEFITLDLPVLKGVSKRAYLPVDPKLPPVRKGDINRLTGNAWRYGDDLPGYPSKRNYEYEKDWLRDVGLLLRHRHPTNLTMTPEEKFVMRGAKSCIPNLY